jgi:hypothetical protein
VIAKTQQHQLWLPPLTNDAIAQHLDEVAPLLEAQAANSFRIAAYRRAAKTVRELDVPVQDLYAKFQSGGQSLAANPAHKAGRPALHGCLLQYGAGP